MAMTLDGQQRHHLSGLGYDHMSYTNQQHLTNPWGGSSSAHASSQLYPTSMSSSMAYDSLLKSSPNRASSMSMAYHTLPTTTSSNQTSFGSTAYPHSDLLSSSQDLLSGSRSSYDQSYSSAPQQSSSYSSSISAYTPLSSFSNVLQPLPSERQLPQSSAPLSQTHATAFGTDTLDGARHMVAMSQADITPRNIYGPRSDRSSPDSYGFPTTSTAQQTTVPHSAHSSISSTSAGYTPFFSTSVDSVSDYSSASESLDGVTSRHLPRPPGFIGSSGGPPAPQSMMGSFNSKLAPGAQKKHRCKVCDKRFTRPSSLQTHMYSHTGEKPFACEVEGCGRNFSVVSNLRRHRKVHRGEISDHGSPEGSWTSRE